MRGVVLAAFLLACALSRDARASAAALESIAAQSAKAVGTTPALVVTAPLATDVQAPRGEELAERIAQVVAGAANAKAYAQSATLAQARVLAGKGGARLVFLQPVIARGVLRVTLDAYPAASNAWDRVRNPEPPPTAHAFAEAPIDAEVRAYLASISLEHASVHRATHDEGEVLAAACGDLDGDGGMELVLVSRTRVVAGHVNGGHFAPTRSAPWSALAPRAPVPMREPLGGASIVSGGEDTQALRLLVGTTDRGGAILDGALVLVGALHGVPVPGAPDALAVPNPEAGAFEGGYDALASADILRPDGTSRAAHVAREPSGKLQMRLGEAAQNLDKVGAQLALSDLDQDGAPEIVTSAADGADAITVTSWDGASDPRTRLQLPAPGGVRALCVCPPEEGGAPALVAVVANEVWIVR